MESISSVQVTVLRASNLPRLKTLLRKDRQFYATVTYGERTWRTRSVRSVAQCVEWNENLDLFAVQPLSRVTISLYAEKTKQEDILVGRQEIVCEPRRELAIALGRVDGHVRHRTESPTLSLTIMEVVAPLSPLSSTLDRAEEAMDTIKTWKSAVAIIKQVMDHVSPIVELFPHAKLTWKLLSNIPEALLQQFNRDDNVQHLLQAIRDSFEFAKEADVLTNLVPASTQANILIEMLGCVSECAKFIISYTEDVQVGTRTLKNAFGRADEKIEQYRTNLIRLRDNFLSRAAVITEATVIEAELDAKIRELPYKGGWRLGDEKRCLAGTREDFLEYIAKWIKNSESNRGLVLLGQAGTGKSSIANEIAHRFDNNYLGSYFAFLRKEGSKGDAYQLFTTLARDLSDRHRAFKRELGRVVKDDSSLRSSREYRALFERLLLEPLRSLQLSDPILIVVDALDESGDALGQKGLHTFLAEHLSDLPLNIRILITSRPEDGIQRAFAKASSVDIIYIDDPKLAAKTDEDIRMYLRKVLRPDVFEAHGVELAKASEGLFQWAAVACGFINSPASLGLSVNRRVQRLLGHSRGLSGEGLLDDLYEEVLKEYFKSREAQTLFRTIMGQLFAAIEPLSIHSLITLRQHAPIDDPEESDPELVLEILSHLGSLLTNVTASDQMHPIVPLHTSFRDFLTNRTSNVFFVDLAIAHHQLVHSCLGLMLNNLKFNICELESSYRANSDVPDLGSRISTHIPPALSYACIFWGDHLEHITFEDDLFAKLRSLFEEKFLYWLEVLSLKSSVRLALPTLSSLLKWLQLKRSQPEVKNLLALVNDASAFVRYFGMAVARSAPHIYVSALPFAPSSSLILNQYRHQFPRTLYLERGHLLHWPALEMKIQAHDDWVTSVVFSPDGKRIASASYDLTIRMWDAATGEVVADPFIGHTDHVNSVAFSPDGQRVASASSDGTIRVWDAATGEVVAGPFTGHTDSVISVGFSPDGQRIASASYDRTIRMWNAATGEVVAGPFTGHSGSVRFVGFSPDGKRIASASEDYTILVWDAATGEVVAGPFTGHSGSVSFVEFSPDGKRIASALDDHTIRVWDAVTREVVAGPLSGHTDWVCSVAFSPDGKRIATASEDRTIRMWDAATGEVVAGPFTGHGSPVFTVAFSPDGQRIASGSSDRTICVWDAATTEDVVADPFTGHSSSVDFVGFSPDGKRIASASEDYTILVWDVATGEVVAGPLTGHTQSVISVVFSPDGQRIASASRDDTIRVWNAATGEVVADPFTGHTDWVNSVAFSPDGQRIASASRDRTIRLWDATTGEAVAGPFTGHSDSVNFVAFSPDAHRIASASGDHTILVWDAATGDVIAGPFIGYIDLINSVAFSQDEQSIVLASFDAINSVAFSPDGEPIALASFHDTIRVWNAATGEVVAGPFPRQSTWMNAVALLPERHRIASTLWDNMICIWDTATEEVVAGPFAGHTSSIYVISFSPDGRRVASVSVDGAIRVWDATTGGVPVGPSIGHTSLASSVSSLPRGEHTVPTSSGGVICVDSEKVALAIEDAENLHFTDQSVIDGDGWVCGEHGELLLWIPSLHRRCLHRPSTLWTAGEHETRLDLSKFVHGSHWCTVYDHNLSK